MCFFTFSFSSCCYGLDKLQFVSAVITCCLDRHIIAHATRTTCSHLVDYSRIHEACYFSSKWWLYWNLPWRTQGQRPESQALYAHAKHATSLLLTGRSGHSAVPKFSLFSSTIRSSTSRSRLCRQNSLTLVNSGRLMKTDDRSVIRAAHSSHLCS